MSEKHNRREFIKYTSLASASLFVPDFLKASGLFSYAENSKPKVLVVIQLSGGNDGLNCVIPFRNDVYYKLRPDIGVKQDALIKLSDDVGLNNNLQGIANLFFNGEAVIINNVGYPNPNRSHFRSMDIWQSASDENVYLHTGWLGRVMDSTCNNKNIPAAGKPHYAIEIDDSLSFTLKGNTMSGFAVRDPKSIRFAEENPLIREVALNYKKHDDEYDNVEYLRKTLADTSESADYVYEQSKIFTSTAQYPVGEFGRQLKTVAELIISGSDTRIYYVSLSGFDTHALQTGQQNKQLKIYSDALTIFCDDLKKNNRFNDTLVMTFSEFGRRVEQNASRGTDHGTASNIYIVGGGLKKAGMINSLSDLTNLDAGDLKFELDFRSVYATVLDNWLQVNSNDILLRSFPKMDFI